MFKFKNKRTDRFCEVCGRNIKPGEIVYFDGQMACLECMVLKNNELFIKDYANLETTSGEDSERSA